MINLIIGLAGRKGAGKGEFVKILKKLAQKNGLTVEHLKSSDILIESLKPWDIQPNRENLQKFSAAMDNCFGTGTLSATMRERMRRSTAKIVIWDGVRWMTDITAVRMFFNNITVFIETDATIRWRRIQNREEKPEEKNLSWQRFFDAENAQTEMFLNEVKQHADWTIWNNKAKTAFRKSVASFFNQYCVCEKGSPIL